MNKSIKYIYYIETPYTTKRVDELNKYYDYKFRLMQKKA